MRISYLIFLIFVVLTYSCNWAKDKAKQTVHKAGEVAGKTGSELVDGVSSGIENSFSSHAVVSEKLKNAGISVGRVILSGTDSTTDNIVSVYLIFAKDFDQQLTAKAIDPAGKEFGRFTQRVAVKGGEARFFDFPFDKRTNVDREDRITIE